MKQEKMRKQQDDRLLKRMNRKDRKHQEALRKQIMADSLFQTI